MSHAKVAMKPAEREILGVLDDLATNSRVYLRQIEAVRRYIERLSEDYGPAAALVQSLAVATADRPRLGTPRHIERAALDAGRDLGG